ncbi:MAG TPA: hypothetical protein VGA61_18415 [Anaerolineae bacterium]
MIHKIWEEWDRLSGLLRIGLLVFAIGCGLDLLYHAVPRINAMLGARGERSHLIIMIGMALMVLGLIAEGARHGSRENEEVRSEGID